jgi:hypothetical protein
LIRPFREAQLWSRLKYVVRDRVGDSPSGDLSYSAVAADYFFVAATAVVDDGVIDGSVSARTAGDCMLERRPQRTERAASGVLSQQVRPLKRA